VTIVSIISGSILLVSELPLLLTPREDSQNRRELHNTWLLATPPGHRPSRCGLSGLWPRDSGQEEQATRLLPRCASNATRNPRSDIRNPAANAIGTRFALIKRT